MITILFFASARDAAGVSSRTFDTPAGSSVREIADMLCREYPALAPLRPSLRFAVNQSLAVDSTAVPDGAEIAVLPPVSGG
ncbi:MAG: molybdopterin converting factor subunit 1 [Acidobacteriota bacterium]